MGSDLQRAGGAPRRLLAMIRGAGVVVLAVVVAATAACGSSGSAPPASGTVPPASGSSASPGATPPPVTGNPAFRFTVPAAGDRPPRRQICGSGKPPPARFAHVIVLMLENHSYRDLIGPPGSPAAAQAPYLNSLASTCALATNYHNITHPSLPNYLAATGGSTFGISYDCSGCATSAPSVFSQVAAAGGRWAVYAESMSTPCRTSDDLGVEYTVHHNPAVFYRTLQGSCAGHDLPMGTPRGGWLATALEMGRLPNYVFLAPNRCNDMHDCSIHTGDAWLAWWINTITASRVYRTQPTAIFITVDEGAHGHIGKGEVCRQNPGDQSCHIPLVVVSPFIPHHTRDGHLLDHYALLRATEQLLHLPPLGNAATAPDMLRALGLRWTSDSTQRCPTTRAGAAEGAQISCGPGALSCAGS